MVNKKLIISVIFLYSSLTSFAQYRGQGRYYDGLEPDLPSEIDWDMVGIGILLLVVGFIWFYSLAHSENKDNNSGCVPYIMMLVGGLMMMPLLIWVGAILQGIVSIGLMIFVVLVIGYKIYETLK